MDRRDGGVTVTDTIDASIALSIVIPVAVTG
jgi:hypothetical protein